MVGTPVTEEQSPVAITWRCPEGRPLLYRVTLGGPEPAGGVLCHVSTWQGEDHRRTSLAWWHAPVVPALTGDGGRRMTGLGLLWAT